jgi:hypothetical protein
VDLHDWTELVVLTILETLDNILCIGTVIVNIRNMSFLCELDHEKINSRRNLAPRLMRNGILFPIDCRNRTDNVTTLMVLHSLN